jgi:hypothetical protein
MSVYWFFCKPSPRCVNLLWVLNGITVKLAEAVSTTSLFSYDETDDPWAGRLTYVLNQTQTDHFLIHSQTTIQPD